MAALAVTALFASCAGGDPEPREGPRFTIELADATLAEAALVLARTAEVPVVVAPDAQAVAECVRLSVHAPRPVSREAAFRLLARALGSSGVLLERTADGWIVRRNADAVPPECARTLPPAPPPPPPPASTSSPRPSLGLGDAARAEVVAGIRKRSDTEYELSARAWDLVGDAMPEGLLTEARVIPHEGVGLKLYGIRPTSLLHALGLQNGDTVLAIDGTALGSSEQALEAYARLRGATEVRVDLERRGARLQMRYRRRGSST